MPVPRAGSTRPPRVFVQSSPVIRGRSGERVVGGPGQPGDEAGVLTVRRGGHGGRVGAVGLPSAQTGQLRPHGCAFSRFWRREARGQRSARRALLWAPRETRLRASSRASAGGRGPEPPPLWTSLRLCLSHAARSPCLCVQTSPFS